MILSDYTSHVELYQWSMISQSLWVTFPNARFARLEQFLSHSIAFRDIAFMAPSDYAASPLYHRGVFCRSYCERSKSSSCSGALLASRVSLSVIRVKSWEWNSGTWMRRSHIVGIALSFHNRVFTHCS